jgi:hypothetical protein
MKKLLILLLLVFALPVHAEETKIKAEQIRNNAGKYCYRCDYVLQDGYVTKVIQAGEEWKLKPKEPLYILPFGLRPESILTQIFRVSPDYGKKPVEAPAAVVAPVTASPAVEPSVTPCPAAPVTPAQLPKS